MEPANSSDYCHLSYINIIAQGGSFIGFGSSRSYSHPLFALGFRQHPEKDQDPKRGVTEGLKVQCSACCRSTDQETTGSEQNDAQECGNTP